VWHEWTKKYDGRYFGLFENEREEKWSRKSNILYLTVLYLRQILNGTDRKE